MMLFIISLLTLVVISGFALTLRAIRGLRDLVIERSLAGAELAAGLHKIGRQYIGGLIEKRVLPTIGYREPEKTPIEKWMLRTWHEEVIDRETTPEINQ